MNTKDELNVYTTLKISVCPECQDVVRATVEHMMDTKQKNEFMKEVMDYNLSVKQISLWQYRTDNRPFCNCAAKKQYNKHLNQKD
jgi:hypothetical protein